MSVTEAGNKQGYTRVECKKEILGSEGDDDDKGEKVVEGGDDIFGGVKQIDAHVLAGGYRGNVVSCRCRRR